MPEPTYKQLLFIAIAMLGSAFSAIVVGLCLATNLGLVATFGDIMIVIVLSAMIGYASIFKSLCKYVDSITQEEN